MDVVTEAGSIIHEDEQDEKLMSLLKMEIKPLVKFPLQGLLDHVGFKRWVMEVM